nr:hypothetical protein [Tanacetum cinerariifolium]
MEVDEGVPIEEPAYNKEEANLQRALELSLKEQAERTQGPTRPVRRTSMLTEASGLAESPSLDAELALTDSETESDNVASKIDTRDQDERYTRLNHGDHDESQARPNPGVQDEGQAESNPGDVVESQPQSSHMVHAGPNREYMDLEASDASTRQNPEQMDEEFTTTAYLNVQENLKLPSEDLMIPEESVSSTGTQSSLQNLEKELSFTDHLALKESLDKHRSWLYKLENLNIPHQVSKAVDETVTDAVDWAMQAPLRAHFSDLPAVDMKEILQQWMFEDKSYEAHKDHKKLYDALEKSLECDYSNQLLSNLKEGRQKKRKRRDVPRTPSGSPPPQLLPPPPLAGASGALDLEGHAYEVIKAFYPDAIHLQFQMEECHKMLTDQVDRMNLKRDQVRVDVNRPLPLGGPSGHVTIQTQLFFNKDLEYLRYGSRGSSPTLSISKIKAVSYPNFGLELLVPDQMWIDEIILTGIDNDIYSIVDACPNACKMWKAIERLKQDDNKQSETEEKQLLALLLLFMIKNLLRLLKMMKCQKKKEIDKLMALISLSFKKIYKPTNNNLRTSSNTSRANQENSPRINRGTGYENQRVINVVEAWENVEQADWKDDTDDEFNDQELEAHYMYMAQIQEVTPDIDDNSGPIFDTEPLQKVQNNDDNHNVFGDDQENPKQPASVNDPYLDMCYDREHDDQDDTDELTKECNFLASLIKKLKCKIDDIKNSNKFLETSNKTLVNKLKGKIEDFKTKNKSLESSNNHFKEANNELSKTNQLMFKDLKKL